MPGHVLSSWAARLLDARRLALADSLALRPAARCVRYTKPAVQIPIRYRYKGRIPEDDLLHRLIPEGVERTGPAPRCVSVPGVGCVPQYAPTVFGDHAGFDPANDCQGCFTSSRFQVHNNCYNYAVDIATNTVAQPGRRHGLVHVGDIDPEAVWNGAQADGLISLGGPEMLCSEALEMASTCDNGELVALLIASPDYSVSFPGDYHWVRCDDLDSSRWSQKDGPDQITDFDFAGNPITDPSSANWQVNAGPLDTTGSRDFIVTYWFRAWMIVPDTGVDII